MDDNFQDILDGLPEKRSRSRLEPYGRLIDELLRRGQTYKGIAGILAEKCQLQVKFQAVQFMTSCAFGRDQKGIPQSGEP